MLACQQISNFLFINLHEWAEHLLLHWQQLIYYIGQNILAQSFLSFYLFVIFVLMPKKCMSFARSSLPICENCCIHFILNKIWYLCFHAILEDIFIWMLRLKCLVKRVSYNRFRPQLFNTISLMYTEYIFTWICKRKPYTYCHCILVMVWLRFFVSFLWKIELLCLLLHLIFWEYFIEWISKIEIIAIWLLHTDGKEWVIKYKIEKSNVAGQLK